MLLADLCVDFTPLERLSPGERIDFSPDAFCMGSIWRARRIADGRMVVLKLLSRRELSPELTAVFAEANAAHDNHVVPLVANLAAPEGSALVTPYYADGTLTQLFASTANVDDARVLLSDLFAALCYLHGGNPDGKIVVHSDIKPANIFVQARRYWLGDWDNALIRPVHRNGASPHPATQRYAPPERFSSAFSESGDYWSMGLVLAEMLLGCHPFAIGPGYNDSADLPPNWQLAGPEFAALPDEWRALLYGLTALERVKRWGHAQVLDWLNGNEDVRAELIQSGLDLAQMGEIRAAAPLTLNGVMVRTPASASEQVLECDPAPDDAMAAAIAGWVERDCALPAMAARVREAMAVSDTEARRVELALALNRHAPMAWRRSALNRATITAFARSDEAMQQDWVEGLRAHDVLGRYAALGNAEAAMMRDDLQKAQSELAHSFNMLADAGYTAPIPPEHTLWRFAAQLAFAPRARTVFLEQLAPLQSAKGLFDRPAWLNQFGFRLDTLSTEQLYALSNAYDGYKAELGTPEPVASDAIARREGTDEELSREPIIWLKTQDHLLGTMQVTDIDTPVQVRAGDYYPPDLRDLPVHHVREWMRRVVHPWWDRRLGRTAEQRWARVGRVGDALNCPPDIGLNATIYRAQATVEGYAKAPPTYACEVRWHVPDGGAMGYDVQLQLYRPGLFRDHIAWKTPVQTWMGRLADYLFTPEDLRVPYPTGLSRIGRIALSLCQDTVIRLRVEPRVTTRFRPVYYSEPITILLPAPELKVRKNTPLLKIRPVLNPVRVPLQSAQGKLLRPTEPLRTFDGRIGDTSTMRAPFFWKGHVINAPDDPAPRWVLKLEQWRRHSAVRHWLNRQRAKTIWANIIDNRGQGNG